MAHGDPHTCASLPKTTVTAALTWCQAHQAWTLTLGAYQENGDSITDVVPFTEVSFGPFDSYDDVAAELGRALASDRFKHPLARL